jgi:C-terminal binding-module, SLH-like, of glucodextranase/Short C-terminal domain
MNTLNLRPLVAALCLAALAAAGSTAQAQGAALLSISDPEGDDVGDGSLVPPREPVVESGDLDLRSLQVFAERDTLRFELTLRNAVRDPATVKSGLLGSEDLALFARRGFFAFNFDLYLDIDRVSGSGQTVALPGRRARMDAAHAWDKAIVLTPRPELMRRQLRDALAEAAAESARGGPTPDVDTTMDGSVFFVRDVRVRGRTVSFTVPTSFVDAKALAGASIVGMVTAARLVIEADVSGLLGRSTARSIDRLSLGVAQPEAGRPAMGLGYRGDRAPLTTVVDLLVPDRAQQAAQLGSGVLVGLNRDNRYGAALPAPAAATTNPPPPAAAAEGSWFSRLLGGGAAASAPPAAPAPSLQELLVPGTGKPAAAPEPARAAPTPVTPAPAAAIAAPAAPPAAPAAAPASATPSRAPAAAAAASAAAPPRAAAAPPPAAPPAAAQVPRPTRDAAFLEEQENRLRTLRRLRDGNLISEEEFQRKRKEILDAL